MGAPLCADGIDGEADEVCIRNGFLFVVAMALTTIESIPFIFGKGRCSRIRIAIIHTTTTLNSGIETPNTGEHVATRGRFIVDNLLIDLPYDLQYFMGILLDPVG